MSIMNFDSTLPFAPRIAPAKVGWKRMDADVCVGDCFYIARSRPASLCNVGARCPPGRGAVKGRVPGR